jgi:DNA-binding CsgD family transcriptional regulator
VAERTASDAAGAQATRDAALETEESRRRVRAEIDRLNPRHREILLLKIEENKSYKEIAEITGLTATNVGYLLHTAMQALLRAAQALAGGTPVKNDPIDPRSPVTPPPAEPQDPRPVKDHLQYLLTAYLFDNLSAAGRKESRATSPSAARAPWSSRSCAPRSVKCRMPWLRRRRRRSPSRAANPRAAHSRPWRGTRSRRAASSACSRRHGSGAR